MRSAQYCFVHRETTPGLLVIRDLGPWHSFPTVTNDAANVVADLHRRGILRGRSLVYYDSDRNICQILHDDGRLLGFRGIVTSYEWRNPLTENRPDGEKTG
jgi:hypothetical protein